MSSVSYKSQPVWDMDPGHNQWEQFDTTLSIDSISANEIFPKMM